MDINDLKLFARAAELGNITHAAAETGYTQSAAAMPCGGWRGSWERSCSSGCIWAFA